MALTTNEMTNFDELTIDKYVEGSYKAKRVLMTLAYIFVPLAFIVFLFAIGLGAIGLIIFIPLFYCWLSVSSLSRSRGDMLIFRIPTSLRRASLRC